MAIGYVMLWRWDEFAAFAANRSLPWPAHDTKEAEFEDFARPSSPSRASACASLALL